MNKLPPLFGIFMIAVSVSLVGCAANREIEPGAVATAIGAVGQVLALENCDSVTPDKARLECRQRNSIARSPATTSQSKPTETFEDYTARRETERQNQ